ncbi:competence protein ComER [Pontibacillus halophilus JSM 076056 = DSM 19796]|uniref:Competence protein ComER n=1 Tax=Pontibacillus halophilus JSM 076056 = DSM 19796 TaxID=1385510 RepID=A0A0A5GNN0_9BACI|nr:late competence protein ComER [Pontibacillus halophilus]KGX93559.1 competence protein ComER [Pontibacillus halophilus JSM 076056 = DSM 19796]
MKWGIIGTGNMGRMLAEVWIEKQVVKPEDLYVTNRNLDKAIGLQALYREITIVESVEELAEHADVLFICTKPLDIHPLLVRMSPYLTKQQCLVSITSPYSVEELEELVPCQVARIIPSITNRAHAGVSLVTYGSGVSPVMKAYLEQSVKLYSTPLNIKEEITRVASDIVSCGPAFYSFVTQKFVEAATSETEISKDEATIMATEMLIGLGKLLEEGHYTLKTLQEKVSVKGGVTGEGIRVMEKEMATVFHHVIQATHDKYAEDKDKIEGQRTTT